MRRALFAVVVLVGLFTSACGDEAPTALETVRAAAAETQAMTARVAITRAGLPGLPADGVTLEGAFDFTGRRGRFEIDADALGVPSVGRIVQIFDYSDGPVMWMTVPAFEKALGEPWLKIDAADLAKYGNLPGLDLDALVSQQGDSDPTSGVQMLQGAKDVEEVGKESLRGAETTHYRVTTDLDAAIEAAPEAKREALRKVSERINRRELVLEVWLDGDGRVRKLVETFEPGDITFPAGAPQPTETFTVTMEAYDFGTAVNAEPPPDDQTADFAELLAQIRR